MTSAEAAALGSCGPVAATEALTSLEVRAEDDILVVVGLRCLSLRVGV